MFRPKPHQVFSLIIRAIPMIRESVATVIDATDPRSPGGVAVTRREADAILRVPVDYMLTTMEDWGILAPEPEPVAAELPGVVVRLEKRAADISKVAAKFRLKMPPTPTPVGDVDLPEPEPVPVEGGGQRDPNES